MNIYTLQQSLGPLQTIGQTLPPSERYFYITKVNYFEIGTFPSPRMCLELNLLKLTDLANADQLLFWGKIFTSGEPYYIALALDFQGYSSFPHSKFYYAQKLFTQVKIIHSGNISSFSTGSSAFTELPLPQAQHRHLAKKFESYSFTGVPTTVLEPVEEKKEEEPVAEDSQSEKEVEPQPRAFCEADYLGVVVRAIEGECHLVPKGGFCINEKHEVRYNPSFRCDKVEWLHFRYPQNPATVQILESAQSIFRNDILQPPSNSRYWAQSVNEGVSTVRSLKWMGYIAWAEGEHFGGAYFGRGTKNGQLEFML